MEFFRKYFGEHMAQGGNGEYFVKCPFPHYDENGDPYYEKVASAHINEDKSLFHCKVCDVGMSEPQFLAKKQGMSYKDALVLLKDMQERKEDSWESAMRNLKQSEETMKLVEELGIESVVDELQLGFIGEGITFPVFMYGEILDKRTYRPNEQPKVISDKGAKSLILPFDLWIDDERPTLLCAGEKDMAISRAMGFNAITFTGGENAFPKLFKKSFEGRTIYIAYDNDQAGHNGAKKVASLLRDCGAEVYVVTLHYLVCANKGEDIHDFFKKYEKSAEDLSKLLLQTSPFSEEEHLEERSKRVPLISLEESTKGQHSNRLVSSQVQVVATYDKTYQIPEFVHISKYQTSDKCLLPPNFSRDWVLEEANAKDMLQLMDGNITEKTMEDNLKKIVGVSLKEQYIDLNTRSRTNIFKAVVTDDTESEVREGTEKDAPLELVVYSMGKRLKSGEKYRITYKPVPHPLQAQEVVGIIIDVDRSDNSVDSFRVTEQVKESLECFKVSKGQTVVDKMDELADRVKAIAGAETRKDLAFAVDLFYHTPLYFKFGKKRVERAYLEPMIVGESRTGKSQTAKKLLETYELGVFTSLKTATTGGLIGGSDATGGGGYKTKLGLIPRNHKGAVIMEEFSGGGKDFISKLTEIRSSNKVRITRVAGTLTADAMVRMMSISNQATDNNGYTIPLNQYPNGIKILMDLIGAAEDVARYDFFVLVDKPKGYISPLDESDLEPFPKESYMNRVRWVWSRTKEQIVMDSSVQHYIVDEAIKLNEKYDSHINFFGAEAWKKVARVAIACAGCLCSMSEDGEKLIVTKEHVDWAVNFLVSCYDNKLFKLKEYVDAQRQFTVCDEGSVKALQGIYNNHKTMLLQMEMATDMSQKQLQAVSGLEQKEFASVLNRMAEFSFFQWHGEKIIPSEKFRMGMRSINRNNYMKRVGE